MLWVPSSARIHGHQPKYRCTVITKDGGLCGKPFFEGEERARERHVAKCARENAEHIHEASIRQRLPGFYGDDAGIPDLEQWVDKNRDKLIEGRKKL